MNADDHVQEPDRVRTLHATGLLEAAEAPLLDRVTAMAVRLLGVRAATVSLADSDRQVVVSAAGTGTPERRSALSQSLCRQVVAAGIPLLVTDARADGRWRDVDAVHDGQPVACAGMPMRAPAGQVLGALCVIDAEPRQWSTAQLGLLEDLTAMAETEIALRLARASAAHLQHVLDDIPEPCLCLDADGTTTVWNTAATRLFGLSAEQAIGRPVDELISPKRSRRDCAHRLHRAQHGDAPAGQRVELTCADGSGREFPAEMIVQTRDVDHRSAWPAVLHDVSGRRRTESELERERTFLAALFDSLDVAVGACDSEGHLIFNQVLRESICSAERPVEMKDWAEVYQLYTPDGTTLLRTEELPLVRALAGERLDGQQIVIRVPGTGPRRFQFNGRPITTADGRRLGAVAVGQDITERHRIEQLRTAQHAVAQALAEAPSSDQAASGVVAAVADALGWTCGEYWQVDPGGETISRLGLWTRPGRDLSALTRDEPDVFPPGQGLAGTVWATDREMWIPDLAADPRDFTRKQTMLRCGLRAAMGLPVRSGRQILGVLTFFSDTVQEADPDLVDLLGGMGAHAGRYMERRRAEELELALAASRRQFDQVIAQIDDYIWTNEITVDGRMRSVYRSPNVAAIIGDELPPDADMAAVTARHVHPDDQAVLTEFIAALNAGKSAQAEYRIIGVDGVTRWVWPRAWTRSTGPSSR
ncbi:GAF domain-containing protein [Planomonospora corallina]|uniref:GAF domain-containing protein n=1 Tax=Planomonospora corallina TaxID=1806052 RepID=A0ABV8I412_9ACTN